MAVRQGTQVNDNDGRMNYSWTGLLNSDTGSIVGTMEHVVGYSFQVAGTFGAGGSCALQGSNDGVNFATLDDAANVAVAATASTKIWRVSNLPKFIRVNVTAGDGTTSLTATLSGIID